MKYLKSYSIGVLYGLIICSSAFLKTDGISFSFQEHWYALLVLIPALIYFIRSYHKYNEVSFKKERLKESFPFIIGAILSGFVVISIWGIPSWM